MKQAKIAIVIPVYNREKELVRTFASIVAQTYRPLHVVLVDNGSTDGSLALCRELKARYGSDDFEVTVTEEAKRGPSAARNKGLSCVKEEFVSFFDSDDTYVPEAMSLYMQAFENNPSADIVGCTVEMVPEKGRPYVAKAVFSHRVEPHIFHSTLGTQRYMARTALVWAVGGWREEYMRWEDWELGLRLLLSTDRIVWIDRPPLVDIFLHAEDVAECQTDEFDVVFFNKREQLGKRVAHGMPPCRAGEYGKRRCLPLGGAAAPLLVPIAEL